MKYLICFHMIIGDSGGPIHQWLNDHWEQVGIISFGDDCAKPMSPGIYTRLSFYRNWIESIINGDNNETTIAGELETFTSQYSLIPATQTSTSIASSPLEFSISAFIGFLIHFIFY